MGQGDLFGSYYVERDPIKSARTGSVSTLEEQMCWGELFWVLELEHCAGPYTALKKGHSSQTEHSLNDFRDWENSEGPTGMFIDLCAPWVPQMESHGPRHGNTSYTLTIVRP